jgi:hypothetical protein
MEPVPPRGPRVQGRDMLVEFDVDCGYLIEGHRFIARGLEDNGIESGPTAADSAPGFSFEYEFVPGVRAGGDQNPYPYLVGIEYAADVPLPWEPVDGGAIAPFEGGESTHGSRGIWPLPRNAGELRFTLYGIDNTERWPRQEPDGVLVVDLHDGSAQWQPADRLS